MELSGVTWLSVLRSGAELKFAQNIKIPCLTVFRSRGKEKKLEDITAFADSEPQSP